MPFARTGGATCQSANRSCRLEIGRVKGPVALVVAALSLSLTAAALAADDVWPANRPEPGKQGETIPGEAGVLPQPYFSGVRLVGHSDIDKRPQGNLTMAWAGRCAYVADASAGPGAKPMPGPTAGVAVIDVRNPQTPKVVRYLQDKGALKATETLHAVWGRDRKILAASFYGFVAGSGSKDDAWLSVYDVSDCANPRKVLEYRWPEPVHTLTVSPNGRRIYGTVINPFTGQGGIQVLDITNLAKPRFLGKFQVTRSDGTSFEFATHEVSISPDEKRIYAGVVSSRGGDLNQGIKISPPNIDALGPHAGGIYVLDNSDIVKGRPDPKMRLVSTAHRAGWHSAVQARIGGVPHLVGAGELGACPGSWPKITNIADEKNPRAVGEFKLQMNRKENCPAWDQAETGSGGIVGRAGTAVTHFNDVDSSTDTRLGLFPFSWAGLRIVDLRNPADPVEIAYFKPGDPCASHVRYVPETGHIWFACALSGFYVIELRPEVRGSLGMPKLR